MAKEDFPRITISIYKYIQLSNLNELRDNFYQDFINSLSNLGGVHTFDDLKSVSVDYVEPCILNLNNYELLEMPPNGQGITAILMVKMLQKIGLSNFDPISAERTHIEAEVSKLAYHARNKMIGDPNFYDLKNEDFFSNTKVDQYLDLIS